MIEFLTTFDWPPLWECARAFLAGVGGGILINVVIMIYFKK